MYIIFKFAYQLWHTMTKAEVAKEVVKKSITPEEYQTITGDTYAEAAEGGTQSETQK
ncbi:XkdX family protein [Lactiplantibacillus plantarum]|uniref:XkdX family protein n=1 Tax=Lactiplantibacillus plantarum TaxID=1590 RepID=UPI0030B34F8E